MTDKLPPNLLALFAPRPPLRYLPPNDHEPGTRRTAAITGVAGFLEKLHAPDDPEHPYVPTESWLQRRDRIRLEKKERLEKILTEGADAYDPTKDPQVRGDAFKTLFVARLSYDINESDLEREFGRFGPIERIRLVKDTHSEKPKNNHRGYAFIVYEREKDMKAAYKETDGIRINDRRVLVDVERGRTVKGWKPRRFGGGLGGRGYTKTMPTRPLGSAFFPPVGPGPFHGGFRGGFAGRGGFRGGFRGGPRDGGFGGRSGLGYQGAFNRGSGGFLPGQPPPNAPSGPGSGRYGGGHGGGYIGSGANGAANGVTSAGYGNERRYEDRASYRPGYDRNIRGPTGGNREPVGTGRFDRDRERDRDRDRDRDRGDRYSGRHEDDFPRKRYHDGDGYEPEPRKRRY